MKRALLVVPLVFAAPVSERAWLVPLLGGLSLALVLGVALVVVVQRGRRRQ